MQEVQAILTCIPGVKLAKKMKELMSDKTMPSKLLLAADGMFLILVAGAGFEPTTFGL